MMYGVEDSGKLHFATVAIVAIVAEVKNANLALFTSERKRSE